MKKLKIVSAVGYVLLAVPNLDRDDTWSVFGFDLSGRWQCARKVGSKQEAIRERAKMFALHRKIAKEYRSRKRT